MKVAVLPLTMYSRPVKRLVVPLPGSLATDVLYVKSMPSLVDTVKKRLPVSGSVCSQTSPALHQPLRVSSVGMPPAAIKKLTIGSGFPGGSPGAPIPVQSSYSFFVILVVTIVPLG